MWALRTTSRYASTSTARSRERARPALQYRQARLLRELCRHSRRDPAREKHQALAALVENPADLQHEPDLAGLVRRTESVGSRHRACPGDLDPKGLPQGSGWPGQARP